MDLFNDSILTQNKYNHSFYSLYMYIDLQLSIVYINIGLIIALVPNKIYYDLDMFSHELCFHRAIWHTSRVSPSMILQKSFLSMTMLT